MITFILAAVFAIIFGLLAVPLGLAAVGLTAAGPVAGGLFAVT